MFKRNTVNLARTTELLGSCNVSVIGTSQIRAFSFWSHLEKAPLDGNHATAAAFDAVHIFIKNFGILIVSLVGSIALEGESWSGCVQG